MSDATCRVLAHSTILRQSAICIPPDPCLYQCPSSTRTHEDSTGDSIQSRPLESLFRICAQHAPALICLYFPTPPMTGDTQHSTRPGAGPQNWRKGRHDVEVALFNYAQAPRVRASSCLPTPLTLARSRVSPIWHDASSTPRHVNKRAHAHPAHAVPSQKTNTARRLSMMLQARGRNCVLLHGLFVDRKPAVCHASSMLLMTFSQGRCLQVDG
ncbi:hypothetical protein FKP32DRAFT_1233251 [Trametes sanguinea]|nr:hypothetical protein FKP32DRAFT_1233251 [Trametes sanguinea]